MKTKAAFGKECWLIGEIPFDSQVNGQRFISVMDGERMYFRSTSICLLLVSTVAACGPSIANADASLAVEETAALDFVFDETDESWIQQTSAEAASSSCFSNDCIACDQTGVGCDEIGSCDLFTRKTLTNGIFGAQPALAQDGIGYSASLTQFYQGVASGGQNQLFRYGGKVDQFIVLNSEQLGLWKGTFVNIHAETRYGQAANLDAVGLAPVNANMLYPNSQNTTAITGLTISQFLSEEWMVATGSFNELDLFTQIYPQIGRGIDGFMNISSMIPISTGRPLNLSMLGLALNKMHGEQLQGSLGVFNTANSATSSSFDKFFVNGAVILGYYRIFTNFADLPGSHGLLGIYSSGTYTSVDPLSWSFIPPIGIVPGQQTGTWNLTYLYEKKLWIDPHQSTRNVGVLASAGLSDGNPNPISWAANVALQGTGLFDSRPADAVGAAYFYTALSGDFRRLAAPLVTLQDVQGIELYYNAAITPWFHLTTDFQVIEPADASKDTAVVIGLRGKIDL